MEELHFESEINDVHFMYNMGNFVEAFSKGVVLQEKLPDNPFLHNIVGASEFALGDPKAAANSYLRAIEANPEYMDSYVNLGNLYQKLGMNDEAFSLLRSALTINNKIPELYISLGNLFLNAKSYEMAEESYSQILELDSFDVQANYNIALTLFAKWKSENPRRSEFLSEIKNRDIRNLEVAEGHLEKISLDCLNDHDYFNLLGEVQFELGKFDQSEKNSKKAISLNKDSYRSYLTIARLRHIKRDNLKVIKLCETALKINENFYEAKAELAKAQFNIRNVEEAEKNLLEVASANPKTAEYLFNLGLFLASIGKFKDCWKLLESRFNLGMSTEMLAKFSIFPEWDGKTACKLALWQEQEFGDVVLYSTMFEELQKISPNPTIFLNENLIEFFKNSFPEINFKPINTALVEGQFDAHYSLASLPKLFRKDLKDFSNKFSKSIKPSFKANAKIKKLLGKSAKLRCGLSWRSNAPQISDDISIDLKKLVNIFEELNIEIINLQQPYDKDNNSIVPKNLNKKIRTLEGVDLKNDFDSIAALIDCCHFVVTVDNGVAHLSSALKKDTFVFVPVAPPSFSWLSQGECTPWYSESTKLIRKKEIGDWSGALNDLKKQLVDLVNKSGKK